MRPSYEPMARLRSAMKAALLLVSTAHAVLEAPRRSAPAPPSPPELKKPSILAPMPDAATWKDRGLEKYGLVAVGKSGAACQIEKVDHGTAVAMTESLGGIADVGTSLGSFSVTAALLEALTPEFAKLRDEASLRNVAAIVCGGNVDPTDLVRLVTA